MIVDGEETAVFKTSFVKDPAYMRSFQAFSAERKAQYFANEDQRIVTGVMLVPDLPIYRRDPDGTEYYVVADRDNIKRAAFSYLKKGFAKSVNLEHNQQQQEVDGVYMIESFITDEKRGINTPLGFEAQPDGTWFASFKVDNDEVWNNVKSGKFTGFSIEGIFELQHTVDSPESQVQRLIEILNEGFGVNTALSDNKASKSIIMKALYELVNKVRKSLNMEEIKAPEAFAEATLKDGTIVKWEGELAQGTAVMVVTPEGEAPAPDGTHELEDGTTFTTEGGLVTDVVAPEGFAKQIKPYEDRLATLESLLKSTLETAQASAESFAKVTADNTTLRKTIDEQKKLNEQVAETLTKLSEKPGGDPPARKPNTFSKEKPDVAEQIQNLAAHLTSKK